jgi:hypothetical protein
MFAAFDVHTVPTITPGVPEPLDTVFIDSNYPGFYCGECSVCGGKLMQYMPNGVRRFLAEHEHQDAPRASNTAYVEQPSLFAPDA